MFEPPGSPTPPVHGEPTAPDLPTGYEYRATRYADEILRNAFPEHWGDLLAVLNGFSIGLAELQAGGGNRTPFVGRFDSALEGRGWGKRNFDIRTTIDGEVVAEVRSHEVDMFKGGPGGRYPGIAVEMEWNNKDPFFDRDLTNFHALHRSGALALALVVTRGPRLQELLKPTVLNRKGEVKYGESSTHWNKLMDRVDLGGGAECPLLLVGIEPGRVEGVEVAQEVADRLGVVEERFGDWRRHFGTWAEARTARTAARREALSRMPEPRADDAEADA